MTPEQVGMRAGMLVASIFPIIAIMVFAYIFKTRKKEVLKDEN